MQKIQFTIETEYFHILPTQKFLKEVIGASKETGSTILLKTSYEIPTRPSKYIINGNHTKKLTDMTAALINTKKGEKIDLVFDDSVLPDYISDFKNRVEHLFK